MKRLLGILFLSALTCLWMPASHAFAGGWAVTTLDPLPAVSAGDTVQVGFVIRQHGVTPVWLDDMVRVEVRSPSGVVRSYDAVAQGARGHYVADVVFPESGDVRWTVHQGWFGPQELGVLTVGAAAPAPSTGSTTQWPSVVRVGLPVLAFAAALVAIVDAIRTRRRRVLA